MNNLSIIDVHTHLHDRQFDIDRSEVLERMKAFNIFGIVIGTDYEDSVRAKELAMEHDNLWYTIGVHPHDNLHTDFDGEFFKKLITSKCLAVGECGLDYFYLKRDREAGLIDNIDREIERQQELFVKQIQFAKDNNIPLMLHGRPSKKDELNNPTGMDAYEDMLFLLRKFYKVEENITNTVKPVGVVHFFVGSVEIAQKFLELGFSFSLGGVLTITHDYDEMVKYLPLNRIHLETDSPYVAPLQYRGRRNSSEYLPIILKKVAELKGVSEASLVEILKQNALNTFNIKI